MGGDSEPLMCFWGPSPSRDAWSPALQAGPSLAPPWMGHTQEYGHGPICHTPPGSLQHRGSGAHRTPGSGYRPPASSLRGRWSPLGRNLDTRNTAKTRACYSQGNCIWSWTTLKWPGPSQQAAVTSFTQGYQFTQFPSLVAELIHLKGDSWDKLDFPTPRWFGHTLASWYRWHNDGEKQILNRRHDTHQFESYQMRIHFIGRENVKLKTSSGSAPEALKQLRMSWERHKHSPLPGGSGQTARQLTAPWTPRHP